MLRALPPMMSGLRWLMTFCAMVNTSLLMIGSWARVTISSLPLRNTSWPMAAADRKTEFTVAFVQSAPRRDIPLRFNRTAIAF
nr:hypothetical protein [Dechloromonas sp.]